ncbi:MAG: hypothetical protein AAGF04_05110 [Chlamydiota bacterium]
MMRTTVKKSKVHLQDYDCRLDISNRLLLSRLSITEVELLQEILFHRLDIPITHLQQQLPHLSCEELTRALKKGESLGLYTLGKGSVHVHKERRKYYEIELLKFDEDFRPDLGYLHHLLKKVPIHILPAWYSIPKSSNHIFHSIVEKFLKTPQIYERHCEEISAQSSFFAKIIEELFSHPEQTLYLSDLQKNCDLSEQELHESILYLEFHFICFLSYTRVGDVWEEILTPFYEWQEFLRKEQALRPRPIFNKQLIEQLRPAPFAFVTDLGHILQKAGQEAPLDSAQILHDLQLPRNQASHEYVEMLRSSICALDLASLSPHFSLRKEGKAFLALDAEKRALYLLRCAKIEFFQDIEDSLQERYHREIERSLAKLVGKGWVYFEDFLRHSFIAFTEEQKVTLENVTPKSWRYRLPQYSEKEVEALRTSIFIGLFQCGKVHVGSLYGKPCFCLSDFGHMFFVS